MSIVGSAEEFVLKLELSDSIQKFDISFSFFFGVWKVRVSWFDATYA